MSGASCKLLLCGNQSIGGAQELTAVVEALNDVVADRVMSGEPITDDELAETVALYDALMVEVANYTEKVTAQAKKLGGLE